MFWKVQLYHGGPRADNKIYIKNFHRESELVKEEVKEEPELTPRATWSYRRELHGQDAGDFESFVPKSSQAPVKKTIDLSKFDGAKFRYCNPMSQAVSRSLPTLIINEYTKKEKTPDKAMPAVAQNTAVSKPPVPNKPPTKVVKISKAEYDKLMAQNKLTVVGDGKAGKVLKLQPGMSLKQMLPQAAADTSATSQPLNLPSSDKASSHSKDVSEPLEESHTLKSSTKRNASDNETSLSMSPKKKSKPNISKKALSSLDIKERLRLINEKMANKLKTSSLVYDNVSFENSVEVNGQTIFNVTPGREPTQIFPNAPRSKEPDNDRIVVRDFAKTPKGEAIYSMSYIDIKKTCKDESGSKNSCDRLEAPVTDTNSKSNLSHTRVKSKLDHDSGTPPIKRVRFSDDVIDKNEGRFNPDTAVKKTLKSPGPPIVSVSSSPDPAAASSEDILKPTTPKRTLVSTPKSSIYDKWQRKSKKILAKEDIEPLEKKKRLLDTTQSDQNIVEKCVTNPVSELHKPPENCDNPNKVSDEKQYSSAGRTNTSASVESTESVTKRTECESKDSDSPSPSKSDFYKSLELKEKLPSDSDQSAASQSPSQTLTATTCPSSSSACIPTTSKADLPASDPPSLTSDHSLPSTSSADCPPPALQPPSTGSDEHPTSASPMPDTLSSQMAQAMSQKVSNLDTEKVDSPRNLSPPLLEPIEPMESGSQPVFPVVSVEEGMEGEMPVLEELDSLPPTLEGSAQSTEPPSLLESAKPVPSKHDNIFDKMLQSKTSQ